VNWTYHHGGNQERIEVVVLRLAFAQPGNEVNGESLQGRKQSLFLPPVVLQGNLVNSLTTHHDHVSSRLRADATYLSKETLTLGPHVPPEQLSAPGNLTVHHMQQTDAVVERLHLVDRRTRTGYQPRVDERWQRVAVQHHPRVGFQRVKNETGGPLRFDFQLRSLDERPETIRQLF
jgi:hypothetical protein